MQTGVSCCELPVLAFGKHGGVRAKSVQISGLQHILHKRVEMKALTQSVLAAAMLMALPIASHACTISAWNGNTTAANGTTAAGPLSSTPVQRIFGVCGLRAETGEFVTDNTPASESAYNVQLYFRVPASGSSKFFSATSGESNTGTEALGVTVSGGSLSFSGVTGAANIAGLQAGRFYRLSMQYTAGGAFSAAVDGFGGFSGSSSGTASATTISSASLGMLSGNAPFQEVDEFTSTRSVSTPIPPICRGDANRSGGVTAADRGAVTGELGGTLAQGFADCNMDGGVTSADRGCITQLLSQAAGPGCS
jgi:hypothetical protein